MKYSKMLEELGYSKEAANKHIEIVQEIMDYNFATKSDFDKQALATKHDFELVRIEMNALAKELRVEMHDLATELRIEMNELRQELRGEMNSLKVELQSDMKSIGDKLTIRLTGVMVVLFGMMASFQHFIG